MEGKTTRRRAGKAKKNQGTGRRTPAQDANGFEPAGLEEEAQAEVTAIATEPTAEHTAPDGPILPGLTPQTQLGLKCRNCGCKHFFVVSTRQTFGHRIIRRRECRYCGRRVTTVEKEV